MAREKERQRKCDIQSETETKRDRKGDKVRDSEKLIQRETETVRLWRQRGRDKKKDNERG